MSQLIFYTHMQFLDAIPVNWFIIGTSVLTGVILFLILTQIPDEEEETEKKEDQKPANTAILESKPSRKSPSRPAKKSAAKTGGRMSSRRR